MKNKFKDCIHLFIQFFRIGCFTFGGGWSIIAQMEEQFIKKENRMTKEDLMDMTSVGKSLPGIMITNISTIFGYQQVGIAGAFAATFGLVAPSILILTIVTILYNSIKDNLYVSYALEGIRSAVVPIIGASVLSLWKTAVKDRPCLFFCLIAFILSACFDVGNIKIVLIGIGAAIVMTLVSLFQSKRA